MEQLDVVRSDSVAAEPGMGPETFAGRRDPYDDVSGRAATCEPLLADEGFFETARPGTSENGSHDAISLSVRKSA